jgi:hypothetical protein
MLDKSDITASNTNLKASLMPQAIKWDSRRKLQRVRLLKIIDTGA